MITLIAFDDRDFRTRYSLLATAFHRLITRCAFNVVTNLTHLTPFSPSHQNRVFIRNMIT
jgi:hypothetical protein